MLASTTLDISTPFQAYHPSGVSSPVAIAPVFPILVALAGDRATPSALRIAAALARERGAIPTVLRVLSSHADCTPNALAASMPHALQAELSSEYRCSALEETEAWISEALGHAEPWSVQLGSGDVASNVLHWAEEIAAELIVLGMPTHHFLYTALERDVVKTVVSRSRTPVLAVRPSLLHLPKHVIVAVDFGPASLRAAHLARSLMSPTGTLDLVYVHEERCDCSGADACSIPAPGSGAARAIDGLIATLEPGPEMTVRGTVLEGCAMHRLRRFAEAAMPDLVAMGSGPHSDVDWFFGDSVSTDLLAGRRWSMLVVPEQPLG